MEGYSRRRIHRFGESVTFTNEAITADTTTDWDDEATATETVTVPAVVQTSAQGLTVRGEAGDMVDVDRTVYVHEDDLGTFDLRDQGEGGPTFFTDPGDSKQYTVVTFRRDESGVHTIQATRR